jgi:hypothetical protein
MADSHLGWYIKKLTKSTLVKSGGLQSGTFRFTAFLSRKWIETVQFDNPPNLTSVKSSSKWQVVCVFFWSSRQPCVLTNWDLDWDRGAYPSRCAGLEPGIRWSFWGLSFIRRKEANWRSYLTWLRVVRKASVERQYFGCDWWAWIPAQNDFVPHPRPPYFPTIYLERCALDTHAPGIFGWLQVCKALPCRGH